MCETIIAGVELAEVGIRYFCRDLQTPVSNVSVPTLVPDVNFCQHTGTPARRSMTIYVKQCVKDNGMVYEYTEKFRNGNDKC